MPMAAGSPKCTGAPCTAGKREVTWIARIASAGDSGRIETTSGPPNGPPARSAMVVRYIAHVAALLDVAQPQAVVEQRLLERERAADHERHQVVAPEVAHVGGLADQLAVAPHAVARDIGADVDVRAERRQRGSPGSDTASSGQGLGLSWQ